MSLGLVRLGSPSPWPPTTATGLEGWGSAVVTRLATVPAYERAVLLLRHYWGLSEPEVAWIVDRPVDVLRGDLRHAELAAGST